MTRAELMAAAPEVARRYLAGEAAFPIARSLGVSYFRVRAVLRSRNVAIRDDRANRGVTRFEVDGEHQQKCSRCNAFKPLHDFHQDKYRPNGRTSMCWECLREYRKEQRKDPALREANRLAAKAWAAAHPLRHAEASRLWKNRQTPQYLLLGQARRRARSRGIPFNLEIADIQIPATCPVLGVALDRKKGRDFWPSIDRLIPSLGYVRGNVRVISTRANRIKSDASAEELAAIASWVAAELRALREERAQVAA